MIVSFKCKQTSMLFSRYHVKKFSSISQQARKKMFMLHTAVKLENLQVPPANRLETLSGNRKGQYSIRINRQWRICFEWQQGNAYNVEIVDYH